MKEFIEALHLVLILGTVFFLSYLSVFFWKVQKRVMSIVMGLLACLGVPPSLLIILSFIDYGCFLFPTL